MIRNALCLCVFAQVLACGGDDGAADPGADATAPTNAADSTDAMLPDAFPAGGLPLEQIDDEWAQIFCAQLAACCTEQEKAELERRERVAAGEATYDPPVF